MMLVLKISITILGYCVYTSTYYNDLFFGEIVKPFYGFTINTIDYTTFMDYNLIKESYLTDLENLKREMNQSRKTFLNKCAEIHKSNLEDTKTLYQTAREKRKIIINIESKKLEEVLVDIDACEKAMTEEAEKIKQNIETINESWYKTHTNGTLIGMGAITLIVFVVKLVQKN